MAVVIRTALFVGAVVAGNDNASVVLADTDLGGGFIVSNETASEVPASENASIEVDWGHLLPDSVQSLLPHIFGKYGHLNALDDPSTNAFLHALLPDAGEFGNESSLVGMTDDLEVLWDPVVAQDGHVGSSLEGTSYQAVAEWTSQRDARKAEREAERSRQAAEKEADRLALKAKREASLAAVDAEKAKDHAAHVAWTQKAKEEFAERQRGHEEYLSKQRERREKTHQEHAAKMEQHAKMGERMEAILMMVHDQIEEDSHGFTDMPFWDDFFRNTSARESWSRLNLDGLGPALNLPALGSEHRILVLEPSETLGIAAQLANSLQASGVLAASHSYGAEPDGEFDIVLELGLLDALAMGGAGNAKPHRLEELRRASQRLSSLLRPGGAWVSVSSVPPGLRLPLLERLAGGAFDAPSEDVGTHTVQLGAAPDQTAGAQSLSAPPRLRGNNLDSQNVANLLLYGNKEPHVFAYRLPRVEASWTDSAFGAGALPALEGIIAAQRSAAHDDL